MLIFCAFVFVGLSGLLIFLNRAGAQKKEEPATQTTAMTSQSTTNQTSAKPSAEELKKKLTPEQYHVTQQCGTEPAFHNEYWDNHRAGIYVDVVSGEPLFTSLDKFDSGSGWPSFTKPLEDGNVHQKTDRSLFLVRTEVRSRSEERRVGKERRVA